MPEIKTKEQARGKKRAPRARRSVAEKPAGRYHHGDLRRALIDAALALIERDGAHALTLRAAARLAGVSQAACIEATMRLRSASASPSSRMKAAAR